MIILKKDFLEYFKLKKEIEKSKNLEDEINKTLDCFNYLNKLMEKSGNSHINIDNYYNYLYLLEIEDYIRLKNYKLI